MFKVLKRIVINNDSQLKIIAANPAAGAPPVIGDGTSYDGFDGWATDSTAFIVPFADRITESQIVSIRRTKVTANSTPLAAGNYSAVTTSTLPVNTAAIIQTTDVRRAAQQTATLTFNAVPTAGSLCNIKVRYRAEDRTRVEFNMGHKVISTNLKVPSGLTTTTLASYVKSKLDELFAKNGDTVNVTVSAAANVLTITGFGNGIEFDIYTEGFQEAGYVDMDTTFAVTAKAFMGMLDYLWMKSHVQTTNGWWRLDTGETDFLPVKGAYYDSYFIRYKVDKPEDLWMEHQSGTINAAQQHVVDLQIYVKQGSDCNTIRTQLDLLADNF